jgi:hypothetical protein
LLTLARESNSGHRYIPPPFFAPTWFSSTLCTLVVAVIRGGMDECGICDRNYMHIHMHMHMHMHIMCIMCMRMLSRGCPCCRD